MARSALTDRVRGVLAGDPRLFRIVVGARWLLVELAALVERLGGAELVLADGSGFGCVADVAAWFQVAETDLATWFGELERRGAIVGTGRGWRLADWITGDTARARAARENGKRGGAPRKNRAPVPGQGSLLLPIAGGVAAAAGAQPDTAAGTETGTQAATQGDGVACLLASAEEERKEASNSHPLAFGSADPGDMAVGVGRMIALSPAASRKQAAVVAGWQAEGATAEDIRAAVLGIVGRPECPAIRSVGYFTKAVLAEVRRARAEELTGLARARAHAREDDAPSGLREFTADESAEVARYRVIRDGWINGGMRGPAPDVEAHMQANGFPGWTFAGLKIGGGDGRLANAG